MYETLNSRFFSEISKPQKTKIFYGGAGSGKSVSVAQHFIKGLISGDGKRRAVLRKTFPSMKVSTYLVLRAILDDWKVPYKDHQTDHYFQVGKNRLYYLSLDDPEKIKGSEFKEIWLEESTEFTEDDYHQLLIRLSRDKTSEEVYVFLTFNPIDARHWAVSKINEALENPDKILVHHSTYKDNIKNLSQSFIKELEGLITLDENFYRVYTLGLPGVLKNRIYTSFMVENPDKWPRAQLEESMHFYGIDFGFNHAMALIEVWYYEDEYYVQERYYRTEQTTEDLKMWMELNGINHSDYIFCDSAEPDRILLLNESTILSRPHPDNGIEITRYVPRFNCMEARKDVKAGIDYLKSKKIHVSSDSVNLIKEANNYKYKETREGYILDEPVKLWDDGLDALRYAIYSQAIMNGLTFSLKSAKGFSMASQSFEDNPFRGMGF